MIDEKDIPAESKNDEPGSDEGGGEGSGNRPKGTRTSEESTGINAEEEKPITPGRPEMPPA